MLHLKFSKDLTMRNAIFGQLELFCIFYFADTHLLEEGQSLNY